ncbi:unnamed protein product [Caenorhabditis brenneri]
MSFPLPRLPLLAISEVIKSMDTRGIFEFSLVSKKSQNLVMLSIPKNSFSAEFTFRKKNFEFVLMPEGFIEETPRILPVAKCVTKNVSVFTRFSTCGLLIQYVWTSPFEVEESARKLFDRFSKIFKISKFRIKFEYDTREEFAKEIMRFAWGNDFLLDRIEFCLVKPSSESIQKLLNDCNGHNTSLKIVTEIPKDFKCTPPPGGYKFNSLTVNCAHWVNLDDFLQCRQVDFVTGLPDLTNEYLNGLLKKIVNLECRIEQFTLNLWNQSSDFEQIVRGLSER